MGFNKGFIQDAIVSETGNWNVAQSYSEGIIMGQLMYIKEMQRTAEVGPPEPMPNEELNVIRYEALKRLVQALKQLISDTKFALKRVGDKKKFLEYYEYLKKVRVSLSTVTTKKYNQVRRTCSFSLNEERFNNYLEALDKIKMELYEVINNSDLIYPTKEEFDPKAYKEAIIKRATTQG